MACALAERTTAAVAMQAAVRRRQARTRANSIRTMLPRQASARVARALLSSKERAAQPPPSTQRRRTCLNASVSDEHARAPRVAFLGHAVPGAAARKGKGAGRTDDSGQGSGDEILFSAVDGCSRRHQQTASPLSSRADSRGSDVSGWTCDRDSYSTTSLSPLHFAASHCQHRAVLSRYCEPLSNHDNDALKASTSRGCRALLDDAFAGSPKARGLKRLASARGPTARADSPLNRSPTGVGSARARIDQAYHARRGSRGRNAASAARGGKTKSPVRGLRSPLRHKGSPVAARRGGTHAGRPAPGGISAAVRSILSG